ncbi:MAG: tetratricopeptide repeat protein [Bacteroidota bacterium]
MSDAFFRNTQIGIYNPGRLTDEEIEKSFITRLGVFKYLFGKIIDEDKNSIPQHYIVIGQRGMGKSTLLHRIAVELRKEPHKKAFIPLTYPEEQYNVDRLSKFWLNSLDALGDALDKEGNVEELDELDRNVQTWANNAKHISSAEMYQHFEDWCEKIGRRSVLLVDNLNLIFDRLSKDEQHELRAILMQNGAPVLFGASSTTIEDTIQYGAPFYDAFQMTYLKKLTFEETLDILRNLAEMTNNQRFINSFMAYKGRLRALYTLTGGTPRTLVMLYPLIQDGFSIDVQNDLEGLMDVATPLYKARFEELPPQMQVVVDAVALHWDPIHLSSLRTATQLENTQLAPQLKRLVDAGWLQKQDAYQAKGKAYEISERFFNIWYLMRRSSRRQKRELLCLTKFLVTLYGEELPRMGRSVLNKKSKNADQISLNLALADGINDSELADSIREKSYNELLELALKNNSILNDFSIPHSFINKKEEDLFKKAIKFYDEGDFQKSINIFKEVTVLNPKNAIAWGNIGLIYYHNLSQFENAIQALETSIKLDEDYATPLAHLGNIYQHYFDKPEEAKIYLEKAVNLDYKNDVAWYGLGNYYQYHSSDYEKAESAYKNAIELSVEDGSTWNSLGNLYQDCYKDFEKAELAYKRAIEIDGDFEYPKYNLVFLNRDRLNKIDKAKLIFESLVPTEVLYDSYWLNYTLFNLYEKNVGEASKNLVKALEHVQTELPPDTKEDWWRFASVVIRLGYAEEVLFTMKGNNFDMFLYPLYTAIEAATQKDPAAFLKSKAVEVREAAALILEKIKKYM